MDADDYNAAELAAGRITSAHVTRMTRSFQVGMLVDGKCGPDTRAALEGSTEYVPGIDVSHHKGAIDWGMVANAGYKFAFIKASQHNTFVDDRAKANAEGAQAAGLRFGYYHFLGNGSASEQLNHFLGTIKNYPAATLPLVLDVEDDNPPSREEYTRLCEQFMVLLSAEHPSMIYTSARIQRASLLDTHRLGQYPLWAPKYSDEAPETPVGWLDWGIWQHSSKGQVPGVQGDCDVNRARPEWYASVIG